MPQDIPSAKLEALCHYVFGELGFEICHDNHLSLKMSVLERMSDLNLSFPAYFDLVFEERSEFDELISLVTTPETYFFREKKHFDLLAGSLIFEILAHMKSISPDKPTINIASFGCSTGEEPYSVAIALDKIRETIFAEINIFGFDINKRSLHKAMKGVYGVYSFREHDTRFLSSYFQEQEKNQFLLNNSVRQKVSFTRLNIFDSGLTGVYKGIFDVIFFRNVMIYFDERHTILALEKIFTMLSDEGTLFLGPSETLVFRNTNFEPVRKNGVQIWKKRGDSSFSVPPGPSLFASDSPNYQTQGPDTKAPWGPQATGIMCKSEEWKDQSSFCPPVLHKEKPTSPASREDHYEDGLGYYMIRHYPKAIESFRKELCRNPRHLPSFHGLAKIYLNSENYELASECCHQALKADDMDELSYFSLGMISYKNKDLHSALNLFKKAIYCNPDLYIAHFFKGILCRDMDKHKEATRSILLAQKIISEKREFGFKDRRLIDSPELILSLCEDFLNDEQS